ncbi:RNA polymerase sigma factor [Neolewinella agarilytica]|uniref:RNA polymerase sigma factor n=1 Tax=Neolewinella agarilytica TaxID=478744 RepID=UPI000B7FDDE3|nr:RNA polymerase sigma factor [Neolewinella agarilytica]
MKTDRQLLLRAANGDQSAFRALYLRYGKRLYGYFLLRVGGDREQAEDLKQQVFLRLLESRAFREAETGPEDISSLLFTIAANLLKNVYRSQERQQRREAAYRDIRRANDSTEEPRIESRRVALAIERLPEHQRLCVELRFRKGLSTEEVAEALNCAPGTVKSRLHYGLKKLAEILNATTIN